MSCSTSFSRSAIHARCANGHVGETYSRGLDGSRGGRDRDCDCGASRVATREEPSTSSALRIDAAAEDAVEEEEAEEAPPAFRRLKKKAAVEWLAQDDPAHEM